MNKQTPQSLEQRIIEEAVRDICSVSVTAAPKSKVREIVSNALSLQISEIHKKIEEMMPTDKQIDAALDKEAYWYATGKFNALSDLKSEIQKL